MPGGEGDSLTAGRNKRWKAGLVAAFEGGVTVAALCGSTNRLEVHSALYWPVTGTSCKTTSWQRFCGDQMEAFARF